MKIHIISDIRAGLIFLAVMLVCPVQTASGWSILALHLIDIPVISANYVILAVVFVIAFALATGITMLIDKKNNTAKKNVSEKKTKK
ncbi:MAG: hypothetical protein HZB65_04145 [Candidatus Aenigmarchaeota archaeon]|nr:hypothetical protein [Candidatus Aenigmarchaeota archaeon]